ncbi:MAG: branched-chain amino acid ABC transporter permease [Chloroflexota bacterium]|nr:branched-chain amino acid ABC transporter permease [Chloroflexota bacterium]
MKALRIHGGFATAIVMVLVMEVIAFLLGINAFEVLITGLALGALYAVIALGYTMVYGIIELINFAHGDVFAVGAFVSLTLIGWMDSAMVNAGSFNGGQHTVHLLGLTFHVDVVWLIIWTIGISVIVAAIFCGLLGMLIERIAYRPLRKAPKLAPLITAIGVSYILENILFQWRGGIVINYPSVMPIAVTTIFGATIRNIEIFVFVAALILMFTLDRFVNGTKLGKAMRSVAQDSEAALMMGINVDNIIALTFFVGSAVAGAGAVIYGVDQGFIGSNMGFSLGLFAFTAAVLGGIGNIRGAVVGGLLIGVIKRFVDTLGQGAGTEWADAVVFAILILVLVFRPSGLLGSQIPEKV